MWLWLACAPPPAPDPAPVAHAAVPRWWPSELPRGTRARFTLTDPLADWHDGDHPSFSLTGGSPSDGVRLESVEVVDATHLKGMLVVEAFAYVGPWDVVVGDLRVAQALTVTDAATAASLVDVLTALDVERRIDPVTCDVATTVTARAAFVVPDLCSGSSGWGGGPTPYDLNGVFVAPVSEDDCPPDPTLSAGEVWLESADNAIPLRRVVDGIGQITYQRDDLTLDDYGAGRTFDLVASGDPDGVPAFRAPAVQRSVDGPVDVASPAFCHLVHDRAAALPFTWTSAAVTYPDTALEVSLWGHLGVDGQPARVAAIPWDDGHHSFDPEQLLQLSTGPAVFTLDARSDTNGDMLAIDEQILQVAPGRSTFRTAGALTLH